MNGHPLDQFLLLLPVFIGSLVLHELGHAWVANRLGDPTARLLGRLTLDPRKHLDPLGTLMFAVTYFTTSGAFGWANPVPVNPNNLRGNPQRSMAIVALAGPLINFGLAVIFAAILVHVTDLSGRVLELMLLSFSMNVLLGVFNLLPVPPLDGSRVVGAVMDRRTYVAWSELDRYGMVFLLVLVLVFPSQLRPLLDWGIDNVGGTIVRAVGGTWT